MNYPTRLLLTCAAIGAAGGLLLVPANLLATGLAGAVPLAYAAFTGAWTMPFVLALALLRTPGVGLLTALIAGLINAALTAQGPSAIITCLMVGAMVEIPLALGLYRRWSAWIYYVGAGVFGFLYGLYSANYLGVTEFALWAQVTFAALCVLSNLVAVWLGRFIAVRLERAGVARGIRSYSRTAKQRTSTGVDASV